MKSREVRFTARQCGDGIGAVAEAQVDWQPGFIGLFQKCGDCEAVAGIEAYRRRLRAQGLGDAGTVLSDGVRVVLALAFAVTALSSLAAGVAGTAAPYAAMALLLIGSLAASAIDGVGGIPFLRAVRHHERQKMAAVYRTYIDCSELIPAFVFAIALLWLPIGAVFVILSGWLAAVGYVAWRYLPKSL